MFLLLWMGCAPAPTPILATTGSCVWTRGECHLGEEKDLVLWLPEVGEARLTVDGGELEVGSERPDKGVRLTVAAPVPAGHLEIELVGEKRWTDGFVVVRPPPPSEALMAAAKEERAGPSCEEALAERVENAAEEEKGEMLARWAACDLRSAGGRRYPERLERSAEAHRAAQQESQAARRGAAILNHVGWEPETFERLYRHPWPRRDANAAWARFDGEARVQERRGAVEAAEKADDAALDTATRHKLLQRVWKTQNVRAIRADALGDVERAVEILEQTTSELKGQMRPAYAWFTEKNLLWFAMNAIARHQEGSVPLPELRRRLEALGSSQEEGVPPNELASLQVDVARAAFLAGADAQAWSAIDAALENPDLLGPEERHWIDAIRAELQERAGQPELALASWNDALDEAKRVNDHGRLINSELGLARVSASQSRAPEAAKHFEAARALIREVSTTLPFDIERGAWFDNHARVIGAQLRFQLQSDPDSALPLLREASSERLRALDLVARARSLTGPTQAAWTTGVDRYQKLRSEVEARRSEAWTVPENEQPQYTAATRELEEEAADTLAGLLALNPSRPWTPPALGPTECIFAWWPDGGEIIALGRHGDNIRSAVVSTSDSDEALLTPFADWLPRCSHIRLLADDTTAKRDLHATTVAGKPLLAWAPVVWTLDLGQAPMADGPTLVVGDPAGDLPHARSEAQRVAAATNGVALLGEQATRAAVLEGLSNASSAHLATHAARNRERSGLSLADGTLRLSDILALPRAPSEVFLSGCDTATTAFGLGIAQAFGLAGTHTVVASVRPVSDIHTQALVEHWVGDHSRDAPSRLAHAQLSLRASHPDADWSAWRVWTR